ncbi:MAG: transcription initiation factor TFIIIB [Firmicutes bacterium]|nr:transcription initiation factor TFIIIB [Bacillota bacterium]
MDRVEKCPECGSRNLGWGKLEGYACLRATPLRSSPVDALVCSDCGLVIEWRVRKPHIFAPKVK